MKDLRVAGPLNRMMNTCCVLTQEYDSATYWQDVFKENSLQLLNNITLAKII